MAFVGLNWSMPLVFVVGVDVMQGDGIVGCVVVEYGNRFGGGDFN